jgi:hypothetical protein
MELLGKLWLGPTPATLRTQLGQNFANAQKTTQHHSLSSSGSPASSELSSSQAGIPSKWPVSYESSVTCRKISGVAYNHLRVQELVSAQPVQEGSPERVRLTIDESSSFVAAN